jgi:hypothetical protein
MSTAACNRHCEVDAIVLPSTLGGMSKRGRAVRRIVYVSGRFRIGLAGTRSAAAAVASSPKLACRPEAWCTTEEFFAAHSEGLTPNRAAAAPTRR